MRKRPVRGRAGATPAVAVLALATLGASPVLGQDWRDFRAARQAPSVRSLSVEMFYGAGHFSVAPSSAPFLYDAAVRYDADRFVPVRRWSVNGDRGILRIALASASREGDDRGRVRIDLEGMDLDLNLALDDLKHLGGSRSRMELELHPEIPTDLKVAIGAAESRLELGGLSITSLDVMTGASDTQLEFSSPNSSEMSRLALRAGAAEFRATGLGHARFTEMEFMGTVGDVLLDFSGRWNRDARATVKMGIGALRLQVPHDLGVRIHRRTLLASVSAPGFDEVGGALQSANWERAAHRLTIDLRTSLGSVEVDIVR